MTLQTVTVTWDEQDIGAAPLGGYVSFQLTSDLQDQGDGIDVRRNPPKTFFFNGPSGTSGPLVANDSAGVVPAGTAYTVTVAIPGQQPVTFTTAINIANGATQSLAFLQANAAQPTTQFSQYLPLPSGTPTAGYVPTATGTGESAVWGPNGTGGSGYPALPAVSGTPSAGQVLTATSPTAADWQTPSGGGAVASVFGRTGAVVAQSGDYTAAQTGADASGAAATAQANAEAYADANKVASVTAADTSVVVGGTATAPTVRTATLDVIATDHPPAANWSNNSHKITSLANGTASADAAAFGQTPAGGATVTIAEGGTGQVTQQAALDALAGAVTSGDYLRGNGTHVTMSAIQAADVPTLNQSTTGNAATATNLAGGATVPAYLAPHAVTLTDAASVSVDASLGNDAQLLTTSGVGASRTIAAPSNPVNGEALTFAIQQAASGGPYTVSWASGAGGYSFGTDGAPTLSTAANAVDLVGFRYHGGLGKWLCLGWKLGFS